MSKKAWAFIVLEAIIFIALLVGAIRYGLEQKAILENNILGYKMTIEHIEMENGQLLATKRSLLLTESQLREELDISKSEINELNRKLNSNIAHISRLETELQMKDTIFMKSDTVFIKDNIINKGFIWEDDWTRINAHVIGNSIEESKLSIYNLYMDVPIEFGITESYNVWVRSENPYVNFTNIKSATIYDTQLYKRKKGFNHGLQFGFTLNYGLINTSLDFGPSFGYGITYSF